MTARQTLLAHILERHRQVRIGKGRGPAATPAALARATYAELNYAHGQSHHQHGMALPHYHAAPGESPNLGVNSRPAGWKTGLDVVERRY